jgi:Tol biopolymer transport system component
MYLLLRMEIMHRFSQGRLTTAESNVSQTMISVPIKLPVSLPTERRSLSVGHICIVYYSMGGWTWDHYDIYLIDADGSNLHRLTNSKHYGMNGVSFSTDSQEVLFSADEDRAADTSKRTLFEVALDGTMTIHKPEMDGEYCAWITDPYSHAGGTGYVFISDRVEAFQYDVLVMDGDSKKPRSLGAISASRYNGNPVITRDGATVYFLAGTEQNGAVRSIYSLWSVNYDGSDMRQFADSSLFTTPASWLPTPPTD